MFKKAIWLQCSLLFFSSVLFAQGDTTAYRVLAKEIQQKYAPDKRSIYFNLQLKGDSVILESTSPLALQEFEKVKPTSATKFGAVLLPSENLNGLTYGVANLSVCNNRANPQNSAELMTQMLLGTPIKIYKKQGGFYLVQTPDGYLAWTDAAAIKLMSKEQFEVYQKSEKIVFTADYGHGFIAPATTSKRVSDLVNGNILQVLGKQKDFYKVAYPDGRIAYIPQQQTVAYQRWVNKPNPTADAILATAQTLIGVPYLWGGTSIKGVDCSGFTKTAFFLNGIIIPRDASQQALVGETLDVLDKDTISVEKCLKNLKPGDLLFFSAAKRRGINGGRVSHTAIYIGSGEFIQSAGMVRINSLVPTAANYDGSQSSTLVSARRILNQIGKPEITRVAEHRWY